MRPDHLIRLVPAARAHVFRTVSAGRGCAYRVLVALSQLHIPKRGLLAVVRRYDPITRCHESYIDFAHATLPAAIQQMPNDHRRHSAWLIHEARARGEAYELALSVYPELREIGHLDFLWAAGLIPAEADDTRTVVIPQPRPDSFTHEAPPSAPACTYTVSLTHREPKLPIVVDFRIEHTARHFARTLRARYPGEGQLHLYEVSTDTPDAHKDISRTI